MCMNTKLGPALHELSDFRVCHALLWDGIALSKMEKLELKESKQLAQDLTGTDVESQG